MVSTDTVVESTSLHSYICPTSHQMTRVIVIMNCAPLPGPTRVKMRTPHPQLSIKIMPNTNETDKLSADRTSTQQQKV